MKTIKAITQFGVSDCIVKKTFEYGGFRWAIIEKPYTYMGTKDISYQKACVELKTGCTLPISNLQYKQTLKSIQQVNSKFSFFILF